MQGLAMGWLQEEREGLEIPIPSLWDGGEKAEAWV